MAKQQMLRAKRDRSKVLEDIKEIFLDALSIEVNEKAPIIDQLIDIVHNFNEKIDGQENSLRKLKGSLRVKF